jgi:hypothetical protein
MPDRVGAEAARAQLARQSLRGMRRAGKKSE